ncbi:MAG: nitroreductase family protein, partial [Promethearchaeota archaeon]
MEFTKVITSRRSIRKFTAEPVPEEIIQRVLEAGRISPSWSNKQGVRYILVRNPDRLAKLREATLQKWTVTASVFIVVCINPRKSGKNKNDLEYFMVDAAIGL